MNSQGNAPRVPSVPPTEPSQLSDDALLAEASLTEAYIDAAKHRLLKLIREMDRRGLHAAHGLPTTAALVSYQLRLNPVTAREHVRIARALDDLPAIDEALRTAELSYSQVRAMTRVATSANEAELLEMARNATAAQLEKICRLAAGAQREDAETAIAETLLAHGPKTRRVVDQHTIHIALQPGLFTNDAYRATLEDGTALHPETLKRIACDCRVQPSLLDTGGNTIDEGRKKRLITDALRRALLQRDGPCCGFPGCNRRHDLHAHHMQSWLEGGKTERDNLIFVCPQHHRLVHEGGHTLEHQSDAFVFTDPSGRVLPPSPKRPPLPPDPVARLKRAHEKAGLRLTHETNQQQTYTSRPDYGMCVDALS